MTSLQLNDNLNDNKERVAEIARVTQWLSAMAAVLAIFAALVKLFLLESEFVDEFQGVFAAIVTVMAWLIIASRHFDQHAPLVMSVAGILILLPTLVFTGGIYSEFCVIIPLFPMWAVMLGGRLFALSLGVLWFVLVLLGVYFAEPILGLTDTPYQLDQLGARSFLLLSTVGMTTAFAMYLNEHLQKLQNKLYVQAREDTLTGLANRRAFDEHLDNEVARSARSGRPLSVLLIDADNFKRYNDTHGHHAGDDCLIRIAKTIAGATRSGQDFVARFGGEEFVVVLSETDAMQAQRVAEKIRLAVSALDIRYNDKDPAPLTVTIGSATNSQIENLGEQTLVHRADEALYRGKASGRNCVVAVA